MRILISNDDGFLSQGIRTLATALSTIAEVVVVAPDRDRSGASNSLTLNNPLRPKMQENGFISLEGTPTDCVHLAITGLLDQRPDMVVSGINHGANLGDDILYSGTVAAAMEGRFLGLPAIAVSLASEQPSHFLTAATVAKNLVMRLQHHPLPANTILNVNVPDLPLSDIKGFEVVRLGTRHCAEPVSQDKDQRGRIIYWVGPPGNEQDAGPGTDFHAIRNQRVSITPLQLDLTHYTAFEQVSKWVSGIGIQEDL